MALDREDIALIKGMLVRGDKQSDIAAFFGENGGRISEINTGQRSPEIAAASAEKLPAPGPYVGARSAYRSRQTLEALRDLIDGVLGDLDRWEAK